MPWMRDCRKLLNQRRGTRMEITTLSVARTQNKRPGGHPGPYAGKLDLADPVNQIESASISENQQLKLRTVLRLFADQADRL